MIILVLFVLFCLVLWLLLIKDFCLTNKEKKLLRFIKRVLYSCKTPAQFNACVDWSLRIGANGTIAFHNDVIQVIREMRVYIEKGGAK